MTRHRGAPLLFNVALASIARFATPSTLADSGERFRYYAMSGTFPFPNCPGFHCFRVMPPLLAALLPINRLDAFFVTGFLCEVLAGTLLWHIAALMSGSRRVAALTVALFWVTWGPIQSFNDPLLIVDPVQMVWSLSAIYLLLRRRYALALPVLVTGAAVKESVLLIPMIYALYAVLADDAARRRVVWLAVLVAAPLAAWLLIRTTLASRYGYVLQNDEHYVRATYFFELWLPNLGAYPRNLAIAALYIFGACGAAWVLTPLGLRLTSRRQLALTAASLPPLVFMALYQVPDRALAIFPFALLIPAAVWLDAVPLPLTVALLAVNAAFTIRMNAAVPWLPRAPLLLAGLAVLIAAAVWAGREAAPRRRAVSLAPADVDPGSARDPLLWVAAGIPLALSVAVAVMVAAWSVEASAEQTRAWDPASIGGVRIVDDDRGIPGLAVSRDGQWIAFTASSSDGSRSLWRARVDGSALERLAGTDRASAPFWSADGSALGFFADGMLKTRDFGSGAVRALTPAPFPHGAAWGARNLIVFAPDAVGGLWKIPSTGGTPLPATTLDESRGETWHRWPTMLPDGDRFIWTVNGPRDAFGIYTGRLSAPASARAAMTLGRSVFAGPLLATSDGESLFVRPFDTRHDLVLGNPREIARVAQAADDTGGAFDASADTLVLSPPVPPDSPVARFEIRHVDRSGRSTVKAGPADAMALDVPADLLARLPPRAVPTSWSPDRRVLLFHAPAPPYWDVWAVDRASAAPPVRVFAAGTTSHVQAQFSPDGKWIAYVEGAEPGIVYAQPYPVADRRWRVSPDSGAQPRWRGDGRELFYVAGDRMVRSVSIESAGGLRVGPPRPLFDLRLRPVNRATYQFEYDVAADGEAFVVHAVASERPAPSITVVRRWQTSAHFR